MSMAELLLVTALAICCYVYIGYPLLLAAIALFYRRDVQAEEYTPMLTIIIPVHNEEQCIEQKLTNTMALEYPNERLEVIVVSDGSSDRTEEIVSRHENETIRLLSLPRWGKMRALMRAVSVASGDIIVFTDANITIDRSAVWQLVANFADPQVGGVCAKKKHCATLGGDTVDKGENLYWRLDQIIKQLESRVHSTVAADGSLYAIRKKLFVPLAELAQADDLAISARVVLQGHRLVFEPGAISYDELPGSSEREFQRKVRVVNHSLRAIWDLRQALNPWRTGFYAFELLSHKVLRYGIPFFLLISLITNIILANRGWFYRLLLICQLFLYMCALIGYLFRRLPMGRSRLFHVPYYFCFVNAAAFCGMISLVNRERIAIWEPTRNLVEEPKRDSRHGQ